MCVYDRWRHREGKSMPMPATKAIKWGTGYKRKVSVFAEG